MKISAIITAPNGQSPFTSKGTGISGRQQARYLESLLCAIAGQGMRSRLVARPTLKVSTQQAWGTVTLANVSNADTVSINGANMTAVVGAPGADQFDQSGTDTADATSFVTQLNASVTALLNHVRANNKAALVTAATAITGNWVEIDGVRLTARTNAAAADNTGLLVNEFGRTGTDTQCATALAAAINAHPTLGQIVFAASAAAVVTIFERAPSLGQTIPISTSGSTLAITGSLTALAAGAVVFIESQVPGIGGNAVTLASSNGGRLAVSGARLTGGTTTTFTY